MILEQPTDYFVHPVYWGNGIVYRRSFVNSISTSVTGIEQRSVLNTLIRRGLDYSVITRTQEESYYLKGHLRLYQHLVWGVPLWQYDMTLTVAASGTVLNVDSTSYRELVTDQELILVSDYKTYEVGTIYDWNSTQISLDSSIAVAWPIGTKVYPVLRSEMSNIQEFTFVYKHLLGIDISFVESFRGSTYS